MASTFKVNSLNYLGINHQRYKSDLYALALAKPAVYAKIRQDVLDKVKNEAINTMYDTLFDVLNEGKVGGTNIIRDGAKIYLPSYPEQEINSYCLSACKTLEQIVDECVEILIPIDYNKILNSKYAEVGRIADPATAP
jgi:hypothetical protein